jgi:hypothetical protein
MAPEGPAPITATLLAMVWSSYANCTRKFLERWNKAVASVATKTQVVSAELGKMPYLGLYG